MIKWFHPRNAELDQYSKIKVTHHINRLSKENHIISTDAGNAFLKIQHFFLIKISQQNKNTSEITIKNQPITSY